MSDIATVEVGESSIPKKAAVVMEHAGISGKKFRARFCADFGRGGLCPLPGGDVAFSKTASSWSITGRSVSSSLPMGRAASWRSKIPRRCGHPTDSFHPRGWPHQRISRSRRSTSAQHKRSSDSVGPPALGLRQYFQCARLAGAEISSTCRSCSESGRAGAECGRGREGRGCVARSPLLPE